MQIPNLPTDNLYKFIAFAGLVIIIISVVVPLWAIHDIRLKQYDIKTEVAVLDIDAKEFDKTLQLHEQMPHGKRGASFHSHDKDVEKMIIMKKNLARTKGQAEKLNFLQNEVIKMKAIIFVGIILGLTLTFNGFRLWYVRLQKHQDKIIAGEAQKLNQEQTKS